MGISRQETRRPPQRTRISSMMRKLKKANCVRNPIPVKMKGERSPLMVRPGSLFHPPQVTGTASIWPASNSDQQSSKHPKVEKDETAGARPSLPLSPNRVQRIALMKTRFADTILRANEKVSCGEIRAVAPEERQNQKKDSTLPKKLSTLPTYAERRRVEVANKAAEELRLQQIQREREAARINLDKVEKTVELDNYGALLQVIKELGFTLDSAYSRQNFTLEQ